MQLKNNLAALALATVALSALGATKDQDHRQLEIFGGTVVKPAVGYVAVVNAQTNIPASAVEAAVKSLAADTSLDIRVLSEAAAAKDAAVTLSILRAGNRPSMVVAPESGWAEINVDVLGTDLKNEVARKKFLPLRLQKMILRAFAYSLGAGGSGFNGNVLDIATVRDLDYVEPILPIDAKTMAVEHADKRGLKPFGKSTYRAACAEGWAPAPTNDVQRKIWDEIHALPTEPLKIEYKKK